MILRTETPKEVHLEVHIDASFDIHPGTIIIVLSSFHLLGRQVPSSEALLGNANAPPTEEQEKILNGYLYGQISTTILFGCNTYSLQIVLC
jgi:hypothetical protein